MKCCPEGSWPQLATDYISMGEILNIEGTTVYHVGSGSKCLTIIEDIFGIDSGRHKTVADLFASFGYNVFMPELLDPIYSGPMESGPIV